MSTEGILDPDERTELIDGSVMDMERQSRPHRAASGQLNHWFVTALNGTPYWVQPRSTLPLDTWNVPAPDVAILSGTPDDLLDGEPDEIPLIVEVADTSLATDRTDKLVCYASNGIPEYWIVNLQAGTLEVYREPADGEYRERRTFTPGDTVTLGFDETLTVDVGDVLPGAG
jgi:Uma2 family endonuclease